MQFEVRNDDEHAQELVERTVRAQLRDRQRTAPRGPRSREAAGNVRTALALAKLVQVVPSERGEAEQGHSLFRPHHGIYRIVHFPPGSHDDLVLAWLWSDRLGVISHETALGLHELSDLMPDQVHLSLPIAARARRRKPHPGVVIHYADIPITDRSWVANVPATTPKRTLIDCAMAGLELEFLHQAAEQALKRGLIARADIVEVDRALRPFTGLGS